MNQALIFLYMQQVFITRQDVHGIQASFVNLNYQKTFFFWLLSPWFNCKYHSSLPSPKNIEVTDTKFLLGSWFFYALDLTLKIAFLSLLLTLKLHTYQQPSPMFTNCCSCLTSPLPRGHCNLCILQLHRNSSSATSPLPALLNALLHCTEYKRTVIKYRTELSQNWQVVD